VTTRFHSAYWAHALTLEGAPGTIESLSRSLASARVDLNPHQVDAALFALRSPLPRGALLADEVGLGKTIEAGLVIAQRWAERRRRILLIVPATLRKQWEQELLEKFHLPARILEGQSWKELVRQGTPNPFELTSAVTLCSYQFAAARAAEIGAVSWDLAVIDEAHRLRNVWKPNAKTARAIKDALGQTPKLLLTATPLQNSLLELYGLVSLLDEHVFGGDVDSFREQFLRGNDETLRNARLRARVDPISRRTLRKQVQAYVRFTRRVPITQRFTPSEAEQRLYEEVSAYLQREVLHALPSGQRALLTLVLRKLLASSTFAIAGTLSRMVDRLRTAERRAARLVDAEDFEGLEEIADEWGDEPATSEGPPVDLESLRAELTELERYAADAEAIEHNAKGDALLQALRVAFEKAAELGAARKAVVFTESRRTQSYLARFLAANGYAGRIVLMNGSNADAQSRAIYQAWVERHRGSDRVSGARSADIKAAIVEEFREHATLLVATESAAEGVNLQFCSLVVNYDLPWNPQRIEQRIGRCHRYGQRHDVVVVNFLNERNAADQRVFQLLAQKFLLFEGLFGASDEILGAVESGVDVERRILEVYQTCRTVEEIDSAFDRLRADLEQEIDERMRVTRKAVLEHLDEEVQRRLDGVHGAASKLLAGAQGLLWRLTRHELRGAATFDDDGKSFRRDGDANGYYLSWPLADEKDGIFFHPAHPFAEELIAKGKRSDLAPQEVVFEYRSPPQTALLPFLGRSGWFDVSKVRISARHSEDHLVATAVTDAGEALEAEVAAKLFNLAGRELGSVSCAEVAAALATHRARDVQRLVAEAERRNRDALSAEMLKLEDWAEDAKAGLERELKELDREIREVRRASRQSTTLEEKLASQRRIKELEGRRNRRRRDLFERQDAIEAEREQLIAGIERQLQLSTEIEPLFVLRFTLEDRRGEVAG
jgi:adenine-specific DNA-methyltransferase